MDVLKQLEAKLQALVQQRNQFRDELAALKAEAGSSDEELRTLRRRLEDLQADQASWQKERDGVIKAAEVGILVSCYGRLGFSPADRSKVTVPKPRGNRVNAFSELG